MNQIYQKDELDKLKKYVDSLREFTFNKIILTNGCFDLFHAGHATFLQEIAEFKRTSIVPKFIVAVNTDESIRKIKGPFRPIISEQDRAQIVSSIKHVNSVILFDDLVPIIDAIKPDFYFKGGDYTINSLDPKEKESLFKHGTEINFLPITNNISTSKIIDLVMSNYLNFNC